MQYRVPKFIEREPRIVGPLTFKQFVFVSGAGAMVFLLYFTLAQKSFLLFLLATIFLLAIGLALAFLKVGGRSLPEMLEHFLSFFISSKVYLWKKKEVVPRMIKKQRPPEKAEETPPLKVVEKSRLKELAIDVETKQL